VTQLGQVQPASAELGRDGQLEIAREPQVLKVFSKEAVFAVVGRRALAERLKQLVAEDAPL